MSTFHKPPPHAGSVETAITWLSTLHRKGWNNAFLNLYREMLTEEEQEKLAALDPQIIQGVEINMMDWLLAEGDIQARGGVRRINDYLLSPAGPGLNVAQRDWLQQLGQRPLRLYDVTDVVPGQQMTVCDALDQEAAPVVVHERTGTQQLKPGDLLGCRLLRAAEHFEMSGSAYLFNPLTAQRARSALQQNRQEFGHLLEGPRKFGLAMMHEWLQQWLKPAPLPSLVDLYTGEPLKMITDHYQVNDELALAQALAKQNDVEGDRQEGWSRTMDCTDGQVRARVHINPGKKSHQIELVYRTQRYADDGRVWFDALAGASVKFVKRKGEDLATAMTAAKAPSSKRPKKGIRAPSGSDFQLDPETMLQAMTDAIHAMYANWADEPIPALQGKTPRQAISTSAGLERVKGLLRSYEASEATQAKNQGREEVSYDFLWHELGISR